MLLFTCTAYSWPSVNITEPATALETDNININNILQDLTRRSDSSYPAYRLDFIIIETFKHKQSQIWYICLVLVLLKFQDKSEIQITRWETHIPDI